MNSTIVRRLAKSIAFKNFDKFNHVKETTIVQSLLDMKADPLNENHAYDSPLERSIINLYYNSNSTNLILFDLLVRNTDLARTSTSLITKATLWCTRKPHFENIVKSLLRIKGANTPKKVSEILKMSAMRYNKNQVLQLLTEGKVNLDYIQPP